MDKSTSLDEFTIYADDSNHISLLHAFLEKKIPSQSLTNKKTRAVWLIEVNDTKYIVKWTVQRLKQLHEKTKYYFKGSYYPNLQKRIAVAKKNGCDTVGDIYVVAENKQKTFIETYLLVEYVEGIQLYLLGDNYINYKNSIQKAVKQLHQHGLASCDLNHYNILIDDNKIKFIDLSDNGIFAVAKAKDARQLKRFYNIDLNERKGILYHLIGLRDLTIKLSRNIRHKK